ncbi:hypothetical protein JG688_00011359 [Phytophthora aleatoria]|uniref:Uncharacterized protein n=1 Tax=Phytophthora aleatoria TaxID=2496075 RepID=A0A8J5MF48_9STRA|nr:hypothetical protein JG688_00011359 [Phytophthora aleatoria]
MAGYYETMEKLSAVSDIVDLIMNTSLRRLYIPDGLNEYAHLGMCTATAAIQNLVLSMARQSPFGKISNQALLLFRQDEWLDDNCIMHDRTSMQEEVKSIEIISPEYGGSKTGNPTI